MRRPRPPRGCRAIWGGGNYVWVSQVIPSFHVFRLKLCIHPSSLRRTLRVLPNSLNLISTSWSCLIMTVNYDVHYEASSSHTFLPFYDVQIFFFFYGSTALYRPGPPRFVEVSWSHTLDTPQSVGLLWTRDQLVADNTQHSQQTDIHAPGGIFFCLSGVFPLWSIFCTV
jgi:hypothetical protein